MKKKSNKKIIKKTSTLNHKYDEKYDYDSLIKKILLSTDGQWFKKDKENNWYLYVGLFHLK